MDIATGRLFLQLALAAAVPLVCASALLAQDAPSPPRTPPRDRSGRPSAPVTGTASISGAVVDADTGTPLRGVTITAYALSGGPGSRPSTVRTGDDGTFVLRDLPAATYTLSAQRGSYVMQNYGQTRPGSQPRRITLEEGERVSSIKLAMQRGGVITGRVTDDAGEPAEGATVRVLRAQRMGGRVRYMPSGSGAPSMTDDRGQFRLYGLVPGEYIVGADPRSRMMFMGAGSAPTSPDNQRVDTVMTYAPGTPAPGEAQRITVEAGQETAADIQLIAARVVNVSGRVVDSTGKPLQGGMVNVLPDDPEVIGTNLSGTGLQSDGSFVIQNLTPGAYTLNVQVMPRGPDIVDAEIEAASIPLVVGGDDIEGLVITTSPGSSVSGRLVVEGDAAALKGTSLNVFAMPVEEGARMIGPRRPATVDEALSVRLTGLRGRQILRLSGLPRGWWVRSVRVDGREAIDGFDFASGRHFTGLEIVVNNRPASIGGQVRTSDGQIATDYTVLVFPQDFESREITRRPGLVGMGGPDQRGGYVVEGLRPGEYFAIAVPAGQIEGSVLGDPDALRELSQKAERLTIREGDMQFVTLPLQER